MGKIAFCFPGQGSLEQGMGEFADAIPEAMEVFERGSEATGLDLKEICFESPVEELVDTAIQQPALLAARWPPWRRCARVGSGPTTSSATRSASSRRSRPARRTPWRRRSSSCAPAASRWPPLRSRTRARWPRPRPRRRGGRDALPQDPRRLAGELQLPRPDRRVRAGLGRGGVLQRGERPGRAPRREARGLGRLPQPARREGC